MVFFKDQYKIPHVLIAVHDHSEILRVESSSFKRYLARLYFDHEDEIIGNGSIESVNQILQAIAEHEGETYPLSLRTAWYDDGIIYDMTNDKWQYVKISKDGWEVIDNTPVPMFSRYSQTPQVLPDRNYQGDEFDRFLKLINLKEDEYSQSTL
jgi:putative DNA primase/helicase